MTATVFQFQQEQSLINCYACGVAFTMPSALRRKRLEDHMDFWCPNGHQQHFTGKSEAEKLKEELSRARQDCEAQARRATAAEERERRANRKLKKHEKRVANGVCPCCNRSFVQLARHMKSKHPEFVEKTA